MPCFKAMITDVITARPEQTVKEALQLLQDNQIRGFPVINDKNEVVGMFSFRLLLLAAMPVSATLDDEFLHHKHLDMNLAYSSGQAPLLAKRLRAALPKKLEDVMRKDIKPLEKDTPLGEGLRRLLEGVGPLPIVEKGTKILAGVVTTQSALKSLMEIDTNNSNTNQE